MVTRVRCPSLCLLHLVLVLEAATKARRVLTVLGPVLLVRVPLAPAHLVLVARVRQGSLATIAPAGTFAGGQTRAAMGIGLTAVVIVAVTVAEVAGRLVVHPARLLGGTGAGPLETDCVMPLAPTIGRVEHHVVAKVTGVGVLMQAHHLVRFAGQPTAAVTLEATAALMAGNVHGVPATAAAVLQNVHGVLDASRIVRLRGVQKLGTMSVPRSVRTLVTGQDVLSRTDLTRFRWIVSVPSDPMVVRWSEATGIVRTPSGTSAAHGHRGRRASHVACGPQTSSHTFVSVSVCLKQLASRTT